MAKKNGFYFTLGYKRAFWKSLDGKITLSNIPMEDGTINNTGFVSFDEASYGYVMRAIGIGQLVKLEGEPSEVKSKIKTVDLTNRRDDEIKLQEQAKALLSLGVEALEGTIKTLTDPNLVKMAIVMENKGQNRTKKKRDGILLALRDKLTDLVGMTEFREGEENVEANFDPMVGRLTGQIQTDK